MCYPGMGNEDWMLEDIFPKAECFGWLILMEPLKICPLIFKVVRGFGCIGRVIWTRFSGELGVLMIFSFIPL
jgi:hypothetical protein